MAFTPAARPFSTYQAVRAIIPLRGIRTVRRLEARVVELAGALAGAAADRDRYAAELAGAGAALAGRDAARAELDTTRAERDAVRVELDTTRTELAAARGELEELRRNHDEAAAHLARGRFLLRGLAPVGVRPRQFVFLHVQKTAGISVLERLGRVFSYLRTAWVFSPAELDAYEAAELAHYDFVCGHFTARNLAQARPGAFACTVLREPVERAVSAYWYWRAYQGPTRRVNRAAVAAAKRMSFLDFLRDPDPEVRWHLDGHQCHAVVGDWTAPQPLPPADLVAAAVAGLDRFDFVGATERLQESLEAACRAAGLPAPGPVGRMNPTPARPRVEELTTAERDLAAEVCAADAALYRVARTRLDARLAGQM